MDFIQETEVRILYGTPSFAEASDGMSEWRVDLISLAIALAYMDQAGMEFSNVTALAKGNFYFDGDVVSHTILFEDGSKKTLGFVRAGSYHFGTEVAERMEVA